MYSAMNILKLIDGSIALADKRGSMVHKGIFTIFRALLFSFMTDFYGDVYYTQALKAARVFSIRNMINKQIYMQDY